ncbi:MAG: metallopeptidase family protein [Marivibrio sp.]|uniref:metallopeptidase family protein n=1 Tax=Marivibrio sp. TaxID=2039719 RepID=UPI0032ED779C
MSDENLPPETTQPSAQGAPPSLDDLERLARRALRGLPAAFAQHLGDIVFRVDEFPSDDVLDELGLESPFELMGLYQGVDLASKSVADPAPEPDMIFLYRRPILDYWCETGEDLAHLVAHVVIHEIGHHWGLSDEDMERIEAAGEE